MDDFEYNWPTKIFFGEQNMNKLGREIKKHGKNVLILHDSGDFLYKSRLLDQIKKKLTEEEIGYVEEGTIRPNPTLEDIKKITTHIIDFTPDIILAIGGGSVIDSAKLLGVSLKMKGNIKEIFNGKVSINDSLPVGVVLTNASSGSETSNAVIVNIDKTRKRALNSEYFIPKFAFLNPGLTTSLPPFLTASGACDIIMHTHERYFSPSTNTYLTDSMGEGLIKSVQYALAKTLENPNDYNARAILMWAGTISHNGILGTGKKEDWGLHMIGHELSGYYDANHGASLCALWGSWARYVAPNNKERFLKFAINVMEISPNIFDENHIIESGILKFEHFLKSVGMPTNLKELGLNLNTEDIKMLAISALEDKDYIGKMEKLHANDIERILEMSNNSN